MLPPGSWANSKMSSIVGVNWPHSIREEETLLAADKTTMPSSLGRKRYHGAKAMHLFMGRALVWLCASTGMPLRAPCVTPLCKKPNSSTGWVINIFPASRSRKNYQYTIKGLSRHLYLSDSASGGRRGSGHLFASICTVYNQIVSSQVFPVVKLTQHVIDMRFQPHRRRQSMKSTDSCAIRVMKCNWIPRRFHPVYEMCKWENEKPPNPVGSATTI